MKRKSKGQRKVFISIHDSNNNFVGYKIDTFWNLLEDQYKAHTTDVRGKIDETFINNLVSVSNGNIFALFSPEEQAERREQLRNKLGDTFYAVVTDIKTREETQRFKIIYDTETKHFKQGV